MFDSTGGKLKIVAVVVAIIGVLFSLIFAFKMFGLASEASESLFGDDIGGVFSSLGWVALICGNAFSIGFGAAIYGIGESIERTDSVESKLSKYGLGQVIDTTNEILERIKYMTINKDENKVASEIDNKEKLSASRIHHREINNQTQNSYTRHITNEKNNDSWQCPVCGSIQKNYVTSCICGYNKHQNNTSNNEKVTVSHNYGYDHAQSGKVVATRDDVITDEKIIKLKALRDAGVLTDEQYNLLLKSGL